MWRIKSEPTGWSDMWADLHKKRPIKWGDAQEQYKSKLISADEAAALVKSGDKIRNNGAPVWPMAFIRALKRRKNELENVRIEQMMNINPTGDDLDLTTPDCEGHFFLGSWFTLDKRVRDSINAARAASVPMNYGENHLSMLRYAKHDFFITEVPAPDKHGFFNNALGTSDTPEGLLTSDKVIFVINDQLPRGLGPENWLHISQADYIVEDSHQLPIIPSIPSTDAEKAMGTFIADLIEDGSTLQLGIGGVPGTVAMLLKDKKDLGLHSEMLGDTALYLIKEGAMNGLYTKTRPGKMVYTFVLGTQELYDWLDDNPIAESWPVSYVNDPNVIASNPKQVSINSAIEVDITGQVCAESIGHKHYSGSGGQLLFALGALWSPGGKSFIALPSTQTIKGQMTSTIVPQLKPGAIVTTPRSLANYIVTEYGVAQLRGKDHKQRINELISIAHPDFRADLRADAKRNGLI